MMTRFTRWNVSSTSLTRNDYNRCDVNLTWTTRQLSTRCWIPLKNRFVQTIQYLASKFALHSLTPSCSVDCSRSACEWVNHLAAHRLPPQRRITRKTTGMLTHQRTPESPSAKCCPISAPLRSPTWMTSLMNRALKFHLVRRA